MNVLCIMSSLLFDRSLTTATGKLSIFPYGSIIDPMNNNEYSIGIIINSTILKMLRAPFFKRNPSPFFIRGFFYPRNDNTRIFLCQQKSDSIERNYAVTKNYHSIFYYISEITFFQSIWSIAPCSSRGTASDIVYRLNFFL